MPSARPSTAMRPTTPLSPRYDGSSRLDSLSASRSPPYQNRSPSKQSRRQYGNNLTLPGLPRFHPANYPSSHSSFANTPATGPNSPHGPASPGMQQKMYAETQRQLQAFQRESFVRSPSTQYLERPDSPRLQPLGSPGPVTPLELESAEGYLAAAAAKPPSRSGLSGHSEELTQKLVQAARQQEKSPRVSSSSLRAR